MKKVLLFSLFAAFLTLSSQAQFIKEYFKSASQNTGFQALVPVTNATNSNLYIAGYYGDQILLGEIKQNGSFVWSKKIIVDDPGYMINSMFKDSDGNLVLCGSLFTGIDDNGYAFALKFNPVTKNVVWFQKSTSNTHFFDGAEMGFGGNYVFGGEEDNEGTGAGADHLVMVADRTTGVFTTISNLDLNANENVDALLVDEDSLNIYTTGRYELNLGGTSKFRICLDKMNATGDVDWTRAYINSPEITGRFYPKDIIQDGDNLLIVGCGDNTGTNAVKNLYILKVTLNGDVVWIKKYDITSTGNDGIFCSIKKHANGYIVYGSLYEVTYTNILLFNVDLDGGINWAKSYPYRKKTDVFGMQASSSMTVIGNSIFHAGEILKDDGAIRGVFMRTSLLTGEASNCDVYLPVTVSTLIDPYSGFQTLESVSAELGFENLTSIVKNQNFNSITTCVEVLGKLNEEEITAADNSILQSELEDEEFISVYPNPNSGIFTVDLSQNPSDVSYIVEVFNSLGSRVYYEDIQNINVFEIDISSSPQGIYYLKINEPGSDNVRFEIIYKN